MNGRVIIRPLDPGEGKAVAEIASLSWRETYREIYSQEFIESWISDKYNPEKLEGEISLSRIDPGLIFLAVLDSGRIEGFIEIRVKDVISYLLRLYLRPQSTGRGLGSLLIHSAEQMLEGKHVNVCRLNVHHKNTRAVEFYRRNGFEISGFDGEDYSMVKQYAGTHDKL